MNEETTEQKIKEYVWLHADEPLRKIQAGILEEYGESKSLQWISKERQEYLAADEHPIEENSLTEPSIDDEAITAVAEAFPSVTSEQIREIVKLKTTTRLGYRKIGKRLNPPLGKDTVMRIWQMYETLSRPPKPPVEDEEIKKLKAQVAEKERLRKVREEKEKLLRQDVLLSLENEGDSLILRIVEGEVARMDPKLFREFRRCCKRKRLSPMEMLHKMGIFASGLIDFFDFWYNSRKHEGKSGMDCLIWQLWRQIKACLPYELAQETVL
ncbi:MAG: hypothetical protein K6T73_07670 [Candidatus Bathyarchaeota archaeon]|nr:hypothetical protein [Candidatus Bathyarchaeota archaeon]